MQLSADLGNNICKLYEKEGVVCPPKLRKSVFTTASVDNIDHNTSSRTAKSSFHGTAISLTQHPTSNFPGEERYQEPLDCSLPKAKTVSSLPEYYTNIIPVTDEAKKDVFCPKVNGDANPMKI